MSARYEFGDLDGQIVTDPDFTHDGEPAFDAYDNQVALVLGNPGATAYVITGTYDGLVTELLALVGLVLQHQGKGQHVWVPLWNADPEDGGECQRCGEDAASPQHVQET